MRVNVYNEEIDSVEIVETVAENTGIKYYGLRLWLKSAPELHHTEEDDDRSAVTMWFGTEMACLEFLRESFNEIEMRLKSKRIFERQ